jgi:membrane dipeptidase
MSSDRAVPIFDGHNDVLLRLYRKPNAARAFVDGDGEGQLDLPRAKQGGLAGGLFAIFVPSPPRKRAEATDADPQQPAIGNTGNATETPPPPDRATALEATMAMASLLFDIARESDGKVRVCRSAEDIEACLASGTMATVLHIEGAEAIDEDFHALNVLHQAGLRSLGPVWSRSNVFGHGVPFVYPSSPDTGPGLTEAGKNLIRACNRLKIMVDLSHLNEKGFWDVAAISAAPLVATHSNAHAVSEHSRNLTDKQLAAIKESNGMVGVNYAVNFVRPDGKREAETPLSMIVDHVDYLLKQLGEDAVGLGSDFDGALIPKALGTVANLQGLVAEMRARQYGDALIEKICVRNWLRVLKATWA